MDYLKYYLPVLVQLTALGGLLVGGDWVWIGVATFPALAIIDSLLPRDYSARKMSSKALALIPVWICTLLGPVLGAIGVAWAQSAFSERFPSEWTYLQGFLFIVVVGFLPAGLAGLPQLRHRFARRRRPEPDPQPLDDLPVLEKEPAR